MGVGEKCLVSQARSLQPLSQVCVAEMRLPESGRVNNSTEVCRPSESPYRGVGYSVNQPDSSDYGASGATRFRLTACMVSAMRFSTPTLRISLPTCALTVAASIPNASAMSRFGRPATRSRST